MKTVFVPRSGSPGDWQPVVKMFQEEGWIVTNTFLNNILPDLVCFTGGSDVSPYLYGEENTTSYCDPLRDEYEKELYETFLSLSVPMVGICRGGQLLNVLNGGKMIQDLTHRMSGLEPLDIEYDYLRVQVDHHQGMLHGDTAVLISGYMSTLGHNDELDSIGVIILYPNTKCLCFQPHPEWGHQPTKELFFEILKECLS